ncbi:hypothetical protein GCM10023116_28370 [Kistimonas scapharcae]|uniref:Sel1 repeat family protein n=1 Tax=Kistimonas scapharcae TaxID=1036133 RepID=A0ABP8V4T0_9GAMM
MKRLLTFLLPAILFTGCSTTPGDAAYRAGQTEAAAELYRQGADQDDAQAAMKLGLLLNAGEVKPDTFGEATSWFEKACNLGEVSGCHNAGVAYEYGKNGVSVDYNKARDYYRKAAEQGYIQSQYNLGSLYSNHYFPEAITGYIWMLIAEQQAKGCAHNELCQWILNDPPRHRSHLKARLTTKQIQQAQTSAAQWQATP